MEREAIFKKKRKFRPVSCRKGRAGQSQFAKTLEKARKVLIFSQKDCAKEARRLTPYIELLLKPPTVIPTFLRLKSGKKNYLDFADLEHLTLKLLAVRENRKDDSHSLRKTVSDRFREVLVDEYQDTNDLQDEIFRIISDDRKKLFCVGDVKQSIYGFRRSNPKNFLFRCSTAMILLTEKAAVRKLFFLKISEAERAFAAPLISFFKGHVQGMRRHRL